MVYVGIFLRKDRATLGSDPVERILAKIAKCKEVLDSLYCVRAIISVDIQLISGLQ